MTKIFLSTKRLIFLLFLLLIVYLPLSVYAAPQIEILPNHTSFIDSIGYFNVVGEVQNVGDQAANNVFVTATFYNATNEVVGTWVNNIGLSVLLPDRKSPFRVEFIDVGQSALVDHYSLEIEFTPTDSIPKQLQIASHTSSVDVGFSTFDISGEVENTGDSTATYVMVFATCYDEAGNVIEVAGDYTEPTIVEASQKGSFTFSIYNENPELINSYVLTAESENYSLIPEFSSLLLIILTFIVASICLHLYKRKLTKKP
jgi:hypothetical protein